MVDTLEIAKNKFPGQRNNLDVLCKRFGIDNSARTFHGALLDAQLLAEVYLELLGGAEPTMELDTKTGSKTGNGRFRNGIKKRYHEPRVFDISSEQLEMHRAFLKKILKVRSGSLMKKLVGWRKCFIRILLKGGKSSGQTCFPVWNIFYDQRTVPFFQRSRYDR